MSRGPKPPIAPKPKISADNDPAILQRSNIYANNTFNKYPNGKLEAELYEENQCSSTECPESEDGNEYIEIPDVELTDKTYSDFEQEPAENEILHTLESVGEEDGNCTDSNEVYDGPINVMKNKDTESVGDNSLESTEIPALDCQEPFKREKEDASRDEYIKVNSENPPSEIKMNCADETLSKLDLVNDDNEDSKILNGESLKETMYDDIILRHLEEPISAREGLPLIYKGLDVIQFLEEEQLNTELELGPANHNNNDSASSREREFIEDADVNTDTHIANEVDMRLEPSGSELGIEETFSGATNEMDEKEDEIDLYAEGEDLDKVCQTAEMKNVVEISETERESGEGSEEQTEMIDTEMMDDSCQIIPFGNEGSEDAQDSPDEDLGEDLSGKETDMPDNNPSLSSEDTNGHKSDLQLGKESKSDVLLGVHSVSECSLEDTHLDHQILEVEHSSKEETAPNLTRETSSENSGLSIGELATLEANSANEHVIKEDAVDSKVLDVPDNNGEVASDSLDDPYVLGDRLPTTNEILYAGREMQEADIQNSSSDFREGENTENENHLLSIDRKNIVTRTRSHSGKVPGYVPETVPEETGTDTELQTLSTSTIMPENVRHSFCWAEGKPIELARTLPAKPRRFILYPRSYSVEGRDIPVSLYRETDNSILDYNRLNRTDELSLPYVIGSSGSFSQRNHLTSSGVSTPSSVVDIPPPFELACITKKPITKSSPSLLIDSESPDKYCKKKKSSFKKFLTLKFKKKAENKVHVDVHVSSSRSSSESSYHGPSRVMELDRRSLSSSPQVLSRTGKLRASESPTVLFYKDGKRKGTPKMFSRSVSRVESFEDRSRPPFMPLPLTKPRSISFPNADTSDYENIPAMNSDYENIQIPPRRPTRAGTFTEFFEDPSRALSAANENDGYVDMSSFAAFENNKQQTTNQETESFTRYGRSMKVSSFRKGDYCCTQ
uniref:Uncharacterized protein n=1 Tax=Laticauda laticaudata TaxID=8630 RepID=A0A8C5RB78_LATLA